MSVTGSSILQPAMNYTAWYNDKEGVVGLENGRIAERDNSDISGYFRVLSSARLLCACVFVYVKGYVREREDVS